MRPHAGGAASTPGGGPASTAAPTTPEARRTAFRQARRPDNCCSKDSGLRRQGREHHAEVGVCEQSHAGPEPPARALTRTHRPPALRTRERPDRDETGASRAGRWRRALRAAQQAPSMADRLYDVIHADIEAGALPAGAILPA